MEERRRMSESRREWLYTEMKAYLAPIIEEGGRDTVADMIAIAHVTLLDIGDTEGAVMLAKAAYRMFGQYPTSK